MKTFCMELNLHTEITVQQNFTFKSVELVRFLCKVALLCMCPGMYAVDLSSAKWEIGLQLMLGRSSCMQQQ